MKERREIAETAGIVGHWMPVTEKLPDDEITVLVWIASMDEGTLAYHCSEMLEKRGDSGWIQAGNDQAERVLLGVTHWCQDILPPSTVHLVNPQPPKGGTPT